MDGGADSRVVECRDEEVVDVQDFRGNLESRVMK